MVPVHKMWEIILPILLLRQTFSYSVFLKGTSVPIKQKEGLKKRALLMKMQVQNVQAIEFLETISKQ